METATGKTITWWCVEFGEAQGGRRMLWAGIKNLKSTYTYGDTVPQYARDTLAPC
jgi:hypothetical protein